MSRVDQIAPRQGSYEPAKSFNFSVIFSELGPDVELAVNSMSLPVISTEPIEIPFMNETRKVAGKIMVEVGELTVRDYIDPDIAGLVENWMGKVRNVKEGKIYKARDYKSDGTIYTYDGEGNIHQQWRLVGCWPTNYNPGQLDYSASDQVLITLSISIDKAYKEL